MKEGSGKNLKQIDSSQRDEKLCLELFSSFPSFLPSFPSSDFPPAISFLFCITRQLFSKFRGLISGCNLALWGLHLLMSSVRILCLCISWTTKWDQWLAPWKTHPLPESQQNFPKKIVVISRFVILLWFLPKLFTSCPAPWVETLAQLSMFLLRWLTHGWWLPCSF